MARYKKFIETDVLTEAKSRLQHVFDHFDTVAVCFSGGKDSLVALRLTWEVAQLRGLDHVNVIFRDEELIPNTVVNFVDEYRRQPWVRMKWYCVPLASEKFVMGKRVSYVQWDRARAWVRPMPEWALKLPAGEYRVLDQYTCDEYMTRDYKGSVALITGVRADESLVRYRSVVNKLNENYICKAAGADSACRSRLVKPIYDWTENDIFKFLGESEIRWCPLYDSQHLVGNNLRVSTPLHSETSKRFNMWKAQDPEFYQRVVDAFPEMLIQDRYWNEYDPAAVRLQYEGLGLEGCRRFIFELEDDQQKRVALERLREFLVLQRKNPKAYPTRLLLQALVSGSVKRTIVPLSKDQQK